jgi:GIY-YIG catalytic domain
VDVSTLKEPVREFTRKLMITNFFHSDANSKKEPFVNKSTWCPPPSTFPSSIRQITDKVMAQISKLRLTQERTNLNTEEIKAIKSLKEDQSIVIRKSDKGSATVIMDKEDYILEIEQQLANQKHYRKIDNPIFPETSKTITEIVNRLVKNKFISKKQAMYLTPPGNPRPRHIYTLPKIHKDPELWWVPFKIPPGRPIVSDVGSESYKISEYVDWFLAPLATKHPSYLRDTNDFLDKIRSIQIPKDSFLVTLDVESMYTNIDNKEGLQVVRNCFTSNPDPNRPDLEILHLLKLGLENNDFEFNGNWYLQISGTAMGKKFAPSYANIFMANWEKEVLKKCRLLPLAYFRFLDDIFLIWTYSREEFDRFFEILNNFHHSIKLKATVKENSIDFLDVTVFKGLGFNTTGFLDTKVFFKPTDTHQLLHKSSFHPKHTFSGILKSQILRFHRLCTRKEDFQRAINTLFRALRGRGYSKRFLRTIKISTIREFHSYTHTFGTAKACRGKRCNTCPFFVESKTFSSNTTHQTYAIKQNLSCTTRNVIYLISCTKCGKQYVGQTTLTLRDRFTRHRFDINHKENKSVANHFNSSDHSLKDCTIIPIEAVDKKEYLTKRENYWIKKLKTLNPWGLNLQEEAELVIPFVITFNSKANQVAKWIRNGYASIQDKYPRVFRYKLVTGYRRNKNLCDILIRNKIRNASNSP